ncbi:MAG: PAS domain-containing protein, partial [Planctomycetota bacterium]
MAVAKRGRKSADSGGSKKAAKAKGRARPLRSAAEETLPRSKVALKTGAGRTAQKNLHEFHVHQIELETQNEELKRMQGALEQSRDNYIALYDSAPVGYFTLTRAGHVVEVNLTGAAMLGAARPKLLRGGLGRFVARENLGLWNLHLASVLQSDERHTCELPFRREDGSLFYARLDSVCMTAPTPEGAAGHWAPALRMAMSGVTERRQIEETQRFLSQSGWREVGENFFQALAPHLARCLDMSFVCIDQLEGDGLTARTVALYVDGEFQDNIEYALKDTPCGDVVDRAFCCFPRDVSRLFPRDNVL